MHRGKAVRQHLDVTVQGGAHLQNLLAAGRVCRRDGKDDFGDHRVAQQQRHHVDLSLDLDAVDEFAHLFRVVVKKADRLVMVAHIVLHLVEQRNAGVARTDDGTAHLFALVAAGDLHAVFAVDKPCGHHQKQRHRIDAQRKHAGNLWNRQYFLNQKIHHIRKSSHENQRDVLVRFGISPQTVIGFRRPQKTAQADNHQRQVRYPCEYLCDQCAVANRHPVNHHKIDKIHNEQVHQKHNLLSIPAQALFFFHNTVLHSAFK